jgi:hypothetical protein
MIGVPFLLLRPPKNTIKFIKHKRREIMGELIGVAIVVGIAIFFLKGFDRAAGRGPKQVSDGIRNARDTDTDDPRVACPECAEMIKPMAKKCRFCQTIF